MITQSNWLQPILAFAARPLSKSKLLLLNPVLLATITDNLKARLLPTEIATNTTVSETVR